MVQLPQVRQRSATSSQRGWFEIALAAAPSMPSVSRLTAHLACRARDDRVSGRSSASVAGRCGNSFEDLGAGFAADLDQEFVVGRRRAARSAPDRSPAVGLWPGLHRNAEASASGLSAIDGDDEGVLPPHRVSQHPDTGRRGSTRSWMAIAWSSQARTPMNANFGAELLPLVDRDAVLALARRPQRLDRRMQKLLPGLRTDSKAESAPSSRRSR